MWREPSHPLLLMELQGDHVPRVPTAQRELFNLCPVIQGHMSLWHTLLSANPVCQAGTVCPALCTCVLQVCGLLFCVPLKTGWKLNLLLCANFMNLSSNRNKLILHIHASPCVLALCPPGFYCPEGTGFDVKGCPEGTYSPDPGYWSVSQCRQCDGGHYCSSRNGTAVTGPCQEGYYCALGNTSPRPLSQAAGKQSSSPDVCFTVTRATRSEPTTLFPANVRELNCLQ